MLTLQMLQLADKAFWVSINVGRTREFYSDSNRSMVPSTDPLKADGLYTLI